MVMLSPAGMRLLSCASVLFLLTACGESTPSQSGATIDTSGAAPGAAATATDSPEVTAVEFFTALLVDNNIKEAKRHSLPTLKRVLDGYASAKSVSRTLLNMSFDTVEIKVDDTNKNVREFYTDKADVMLIFTGVKNDEKVVNMRMVKMEKHNGKWLVAVIKDDPFSRTKI